MADEGVPTQWTRDDQQCSFITSLFDMTIEREPVTVELTDIDVQASLSIGQNRAEMTLDADTIELLALYAADGVAMRMPLVWRPGGRSKKYVVLDGNHRIGMVRLRGETSFPAVMVRGESQLAQRLAIVVNTMHGRSTRSPEYVALAMRQLRDAGVPMHQIARLFGETEAKVKVITRRDLQQERLRELLPERRQQVPLHTLDNLGHVEDAHVRILGDAFIDAPKSVQLDVVRRLQDAPSALRDAVAHEVLGELREAERQKHRQKAGASKPSTRLQDGLQRLANVPDMLKAFYASTDQQKALMRSTLVIVLPRLTQLHQQLLQSEAS